VSTSKINLFMSKVCNQTREVDELVRFFDSQVDPESLRAWFSKGQSAVPASQLVEYSERTHHFVVSGGEHLDGTAES
jgi:hypothetical protein